MKTKKTLIVLALLISSLIAGGMVMAGPKKKDSYGKEQVILHDIVRLKEGSVRIIYRAMAETLWYCPGVDTKKGATGTEVVFVRQRIRDKTKADFPAKAYQGPEKGLHVVIIPSDGKAIFLRHGKRITEILPKAGE